MRLVYGKGAFVNGHKCLCCDEEVVPLIDFGSMPLVNTYSVKTQYPLYVNRCPKCYHLQLNECVDPEVLYSYYTYCSGTGRTALDYFRDFARTAVSYVPEANIVLDIASNDGSQLDAFKALGLKTYGVDPAVNLSKMAAAKGHTIHTAFFEDMSTDVDHQLFDIITAQNVVGHSTRPLDFLINCKNVMHDESRLFIATSQANLIVNGECDTIYHEHVSYFNAHSMLRLAERADLEVIDIVMHDIHGTSYVFVLGKKTGPRLSWTSHNRVKARLEWEQSVGMMSPPLYHWWKSHVKDKINRVGETIDAYRRDGFYTVGCGAAAKGISMLNMAHIKLDVIVDTTPTKWNQETSGMKIVPFDEIKEFKQDKILFVVLAWNVGQEIRSKVLALRDNKNDVFIETR
jgi:2-polyprenyl-3-methyl-5-hydroxy-6-metoxy-1,4-benzoquinol methylase